MRGLVVLGKLRLSLAAAALLPALAAGCATTTTRPNYPQEPSWTDKVSASLKGGTAKIASIVAPKPTPGEETTLQPSKKPGPGVYVAMAELHERSGRIEEAETQLRKALAMDPNHLGALLAYAHLEDRQRNFQAAIRYYQRALKKHSKDGSVYNDMGLCYHRHAKLDEAATTLEKAVELEPQKKLYRDNLAAVLVDQGKTDAALAQLIEAHGRPVGHYNLAFLLVQKHDNQAALQHFRTASQLDPTFGEAQQWVAQLSTPATHAMPTASVPPAAMIARREPPPSYTPGSIASDTPNRAYSGSQTASGYAGTQSGQPARPQGANSRRLPPQQQNPLR